MNKSSKRTTDDEKHIALTEAFECCKEQDGTALIKEMAEFTNGHPARRTLERYIERFSDEFELKDGVVRRLK